MIPENAPAIDERNSATVLAQFERRRYGYAPRWNPPEKSAGGALAQIFSRFLEAVIQRLNQAPLKNKLAMFDLLGFRVVPAQSARAPVVFKLNDGSPDSSAPRGTQVAAPPPPGSSQQIVFETEEDIGVSGAKLSQVVSLWPGRDQYIDHSDANASGQQMVLFEALKLQPVPHVIYIAHSAVLNFAGKVHLEVEFGLAQGASSPLDIVWEYWDSQVWRQFKSLKPSCLEAAEAGHDGTQGLTKDGSVRLDTDAAQTALTMVNGVSSFWIRGRLDQPLPPNPAQTLPLAETIRLRTLIDQALELKVSTVFLPRVGPTVLVAVDENRQLLPKVTVTITEVEGQLLFPSETTGDKGVKVTSWPLQQGKTYQVDVSFQGITGTAFAKYNLMGTGAWFVVVVKVEGLAPDKALTNSKAVDVSKAFFPLTQSPLPGATFYFKQNEILSKPNANVSVYLSCNPAPVVASPDTSVPHVLIWEYWNGEEWVALLQSIANSTDFTRTEVVEFTVPNDLRSTKVNNEDGFWIRVRLASGGYGVKKEIKFTTTNPQVTVDYIEPAPPIVNRFCFGYSWVQGPAQPEKVLTYNDFQFEDQTEKARWPGTKFSLYSPVAEVTPALYLGFSKALPVNNFGIYFDIAEQSGGKSGPGWLWEYWNGAGWQKLLAQDETRNLQLPGMVSFLAESDSCALARFDKPLHWVRGRLDEDTDPNPSTINRIFPNAVWAAQLRTVTNLPLGASTGARNQIFQFTQIPVLKGQTIEVQELAGPRANTEWRLIAMSAVPGDPSVISELENRLADEGTQTDIFFDKVHLKRDKKKLVVEVWVQWNEQENFFESKPEARDYVLDHASGRLFFGNGKAGKIPPIAAAIQAARFQTGGGLAGNVAAGTITQLLGTVSGVSGVSNPRAAEGGADGETLEEFSLRVPKGIRNRGRTISLADYENLAHEASAGVAVARAVPTLNPEGIRLPGWITVIIVPHSQEPRPMPSFGLRTEVQTYLEKNAPGDVAAAHQIRVIGPTYLAVDVAATIAPKDPTTAGEVEQSARKALQDFLHPLYGGPGGKGWDLGRDVFLSDIASVLADVDGADFVEDLSLFVNGVLQGNAARIPAGQIAVAGDLNLNLTVAV